MYMKQCVMQPSFLLMLTVEIQVIGHRVITIFLGSYLLIQILCHRILSQPPLILPALSRLHLIRQQETILLIELLVQLLGILGCRRHRTLSLMSLLHLLIHLGNLHHLRPHLRRHQIHALYLAPTAIPPHHLLFASLHVHMPA